MSVAEQLEKDADAIKENQKNIKEKVASMSKKEEEIEDAYAEGDSDSEEEEWEDDD